MGVWSHYGGSTWMTSTASSRYPKLSLRVSDTFVSSLHYPSNLKSWARSLVERSDKQFALGAFESGRLIGAASYFMCNEPGCAEVAIVVAHHEHMRGVGTVLLGRLGQIARDNGLDRFVADVLTENFLMRKVMSDAGWPCTIHADGAELRVDVNLAELAQ